MKAKTKGLIIMLVFLYSSNSHAQTVVFKRPRLNNQEIQAKALEKFEMRTTKNKKEELLKNQVAKKIISRRRVLNQK